MRSALIDPQTEKTKYIKFMSRPTLARSLFGRTGANEPPHSRDNNCIITPINETPSHIQ